MPIALKQHGGIFYCIALSEFNQTDRHHRLLKYALAVKIK